MSLSNLFVDNKYNLHAQKYIMQTTANAITTSISALQVFNGIAVVDVVAGNVACQLPTAASLVALFNNLSVGDTITCLFSAIGGANSLTLTTNTGLTLTGVPTMAQNISRVVYFRFTNVGLGTETISVY